MFFIKDAYATIWKTEQKEKYVVGRVSTSEKLQDDKGYENSTWYTLFVGKAKDKIIGLPEKTKITILSGKLTNVMTEYKGEKKPFQKLVVFDIQVQGEKTKKTNTKKAELETEEDPDALPF